MNTTATMAERFCAYTDPDDATAFANEAGCQWVLCMDDSAEGTFSDGSVASCLNGGEWLPMSLHEQGKLPALTRAERDGVDPALWDHHTQAEQDRDADR